MAADDNFLFEVAKFAVLSSVSDLDTIRHRQHVLRDCAKHESIVRDIYQLTIEAIEGERKHYLSFFARYPSGILSHAVSVLQMFVGMLEKLRAIADQHAEKFESDGYSRLFAMLRQELSDEYFARIKVHLKRLKFNKGILISAELGRGNNSTNYVPRKPREDKRNWIARLIPPGYTFHLHPRDEAGARQSLEEHQRTGLEGGADTGGLSLLVPACPAAIFFTVVICLA